MYFLICIGILLDCLKNFLNRVNENFIFIEILLVKNEYCLF